MRTGTVAEIAGTKVSAEEQWDVPTLGLFWQKDREEFLAV